MRFRLRDILLLMLLAAVYLTTFRYVYRASEDSTGLQTGALIAVWVLAPAFLLFFPLITLIGHRWAVRKAQPIWLEIHAPIPWKSLSLQFAVTIGCGIVTIVVAHPIGLAIFVGISMPFVGILPTTVFLGTVKAGARGVVYQSAYKVWSELEVFRNDNGLIEAFTLVGAPWGTKRTPIRRFLSSKLTLYIPEKQQQEFTELFE